MLREGWGRGRIIFLLLKKNRKQFLFAKTKQSTLKQREGYVERERIFFFF